MGKTIDQIIYDLHWMARRYADGRSSYAPGSLNDNVRTLLEMGYELKRPFFARDGMGRQFDGLSEQDVQDAEDDMPMGMMQVVTEAEERAAALRSKVIDEAIEALSGEIKSCTLGWDLADKISEADAVKLLDTQRKIDIQALTALKSATNNREAE